MCPYIRKGENLNGWYYYCDAVAFGLKLTSAELLQIGCTEEQRNICRGLMEMSVGVGIVPVPIDSLESDAASC